MNSYTEAHRPKSGTGLRIWRALKASGFHVLDLHYNPNCWGKGALDGWGTWACEVRAPSGDHLAAWCGWDKQSGCAYLEQTLPPFRRSALDSQSRQEDAISDHENH